MKIYIITHTSIDEDMGEAMVVGAYASLENAVEKMRNAIYAEFEENKGWWEDDDEGGEYIEEQYKEWIGEQYADDECTLWIYTNDAPIEYIFKIHQTSIEFETELREAYAVLRTCIDGENNNTELIGVYVTQDEANNAVRGYQAEHKCDENDGFIENILSVERFSIKV